MDYHYTLFIDEAGDDKVERLKPENPDGNSEWLCLGGYLIRADAESDLDRRRDEILAAIGGKPGGVLHFQKLHPKNRVKAVQALPERCEDGEFRPGNMGWRGIAGRRIGEIAADAGPNGAKSACDRPRDCSFCAHDNGFKAGQATAYDQCPPDSGLASFSPQNLPSFRRK